jgi:hypothetical protein
MIQVTIKENAWLARWAAHRLCAYSCAIVFGKTICLHNVSRDQFLEDESYVFHEVTHVKQWLKHGYFIFPIKYVYYSFKYGYYNNPFEKEAREMESQEKIMANVKIL